MFAKGSWTKSTFKVAHEYKNNNIEWETWKLLEASRMKVKLRHARTQNGISKQNKNESSQLLIAYTFVVVILSL